MLGVSDLLILVFILVLLVLIIIHGRKKPVKLSEIDNADKWIDIENLQLNPETHRDLVQVADLDAISPMSLTLSDMSQINLKSIPPSVTSLTLKNCSAKLGDIPPTVKDLKLIKVNVKDSLGDIKAETLSLVSIKTDYTCISPTVKACSIEYDEKYKHKIDILTQLKNTEITDLYVKTPDINLHHLPSKVKKLKLGCYPQNCHSIPPVDTLILEGINLQGKNILSKIPNLHTLQMNNVTNAPLKDITCNVVTLHMFKSTWTSDTSKATNFVIDDTITINLSQTNFKFTGDIAVLNGNDGQLRKVYNLDMELPKNIIMINMPLVNQASLPELDTLTIMGKTLVVNKIPPRVKTIIISGVVEELSIEQYIESEFVLDTSNTPEFFCDIANAFVKCPLLDLKSRYSDLNLKDLRCPYLKVDRPDEVNLPKVGKVERS